MKRRTISLSSVYLLIAVLAIAWPAVAQVKYHPIDLGTLGGSSSSANGVEFLNAVGGSLTTDDAASHAFSAILPISDEGHASSLKDLGTLGGTNSSAQAVDILAQIVGQSDTSDGTSHAFLYRKSMVDLGTLGGSNSQANAVNLNLTARLATQIAGWSLTIGDAAMHAVTWDADKNILDLGTLGGTNSTAFGNNCRGQVVGSSDTAGDATTDAFVWDSVHGMEDLGTLGGSSSQANGINCEGQIVGFAFLAGDLQADAFLDTKGTMTDLGNLGGSFSQANAISDLGWVVGASNITGDADVHAFVWTSKGGMLDLNNLIPATSGWDLQSANSISDNGYIVGVGTINGVGHAFALIPEDHD